MKRIIISLLAIGVCSTASANSALPENAIPGKCYAKVVTPAKYRYVKKKVLASEASSRFVTIPAKYKNVKKTVIVKEPSQKLVVVPATYKMVNYRLKVSDESRKLIPVKAQYSKVAKSVLVKNAGKVWKRGKGPGQKTNAHGEIYCLVESPAVYKTVYGRVLTKPASTLEVVTPAKYKIIKKTIVDQPATTRTVQIPGQKKIVNARQLVAPASQKTISTPATYQYVTKKIMTKSAKMEWTPILCNTNTTSDVIKAVQNSLQDNGFTPGNLDGVYGMDTQKAIEKYQRTKGLAVGYLTEETLDSLEVNAEI